MIYTKIQFGITLSVILLDILWINLFIPHFYFDVEGISFVFLFFLFLFCLCFFYKKIRPNPNIAALIQSTLFFYTFLPAVLVLSYLVATVNQPFIDSTLASLDRALGVYTPSIVFWFKEHPYFYNVFYYIYWPYYEVQLPFIIIYFSFCGKLNHLQRVLMHFIIAVLLTEIISAFFPATGPYGWYHYVPNDTLSQALNHLYQLRQNIVDIRQIDGIVMMPSFHTVMAFVYAYAFRFEKKILFVPILILNFVMILTCLPIGEHYFVDILAAIPVFLIILGIEALIYRSVIRVSDKKAGERIKGVPLKDPLIYETP